MPFFICKQTMPGCAKQAGVQSKAQAKTPTRMTGAKKNGLFPNNDHQIHFNYTDTKKELIKKSREKNIVQYGEKTG